MFRMFRRPVEVRGGAVAVPLFRAMPRAREAKPAKPKTRRQRPAATPFVRSDFDPFIGRRV